MKHLKVILGIITASAAVWLITDFAKRQSIPEYDDYVKVENTEYILHKNDCSNMVAALYWNYKAKDIEVEVHAYDTGQPIGHAVLHLPEEGLYLDPSRQTLYTEVPKHWKLKRVVSEKELETHLDWHPTEIEK